MRTIVVELACMTLWTVACAGHPDGSGAGVDAAPTIDAPEDVSMKMLVVRGAAGVENLVYVSPDGEKSLSSTGGTPLCGDKIFCDSPPSTVATRFPFIDVLDSSTAVFLDAAGPAVYSVELYAQRAIGWRGRRAAWLSAVGFGIVLLNFVPVSYFFTTSHNF